MEKNKKIDIFIIFLIFISILSIIILRPLNDLDEIWNYNFARCFANGLIPYKDFNIIITPLLSIITGLILKFTIDELIVMRILAAILCTAIMYRFYKILELLKIRKELRIIYVLVTIYIFRDIFTIDYNFAIIYVALIITFYEIKYYLEDNSLIKYNFKKDTLLGILGGIAITIKHTIGICICIVLLGNKLLHIRNKKEFKIYLKSFIYRLLGIIIPIIILLIYLYINNALGDFINYAILGISEFKNYISYIKLIKLNFWGILSVLVPIAFVYAGIKSIILKKDKKLYILLVYGIATFSICFPISDVPHFSVAALIAVIIIIYESYNLIMKCDVISDVRKYLKIILIFNAIFWFLLYIFFDFKNILQYIEASESFVNIKHYKKIYISPFLEKRIDDVDNFIKSSDKNVVIIDSAAATYMIPLEKYNKDFDMLNNGNLGKNGNKKIIKQIEESKDTQYLIINDPNLYNWQLPLEIIDYVTKNKRKVDSVNIYDVYE